MKRRIQETLPVFLSVMIVIMLMLVDGAFGTALGCDYYAAPNGTGNGLSSSSPFKIANFWKFAKPGKVLCLQDGIYAGSSSTINPPSYLKGISGAPITVKALNDGKVLIDGQGKRTPILLVYNDWFIIEGMNACCSGKVVVQISKSNHNIVRRVSAWDAFDGNTNIFGIHSDAHYNILEDVAGWGIARKIFSASQGGNFTTIRRAWGRWEGSHVTGPKMVYALTYNNRDMTCENCIGTWSGERMKKTYTLLDYHGKPWRGRLDGTYTGYGVNQPYGIFAIDALPKGDRNARAKLLGSIAYVRAADRFHPSKLVFVVKLDSVKLEHVVAYIEPGSHTTKRTFALLNLPSSLGGPAKNLVVKNITGIGGAGAEMQPDWEKHSIVEGSTIGETGGVFNSSQGAKICHRYKNGLLTNEPLWPWPMNQRIIDAMKQSGRRPVDVTRTIEDMFGPIPSSCKSDRGATGSVSSTTPPIDAPSTPSNLRVAE